MERTEENSNVCTRHTWYFYLHIQSDFAQTKPIFQKHLNKLRLYPFTDQEITKTLQSRDLSQFCLFVLSKPLEKHINKHLCCSSRVGGDEGEVVGRGAFSRPQNRLQTPKNSSAGGAVGHPSRQSEIRVRVFVQLMGCTVPTFPMQWWSTW